MRPIRLKMTAFGSYADETVIDFDRLGTNGLYLITGETGSGKTTIFDAITYALFGELSDDVREPGMMRSTYADPKVTTVVELDFEYRGMRYNVKRTPSYERPKLNGTGTTTQNGSAEFTQPNGRPPVINHGEVTKAIVELLGITRSQFTQTVMIAQGKFRDLLTVKGSERQKVFRSLFDTYIYNDFQDKIRERTSAAKREFDDLRGEILQLSNDVMCEEGSPIAEQKALVSEGAFDLSQIEELEKLLAAQNSEDTAAKNDLERSHNDANEKLHEITAELERGNSQREWREKLDELKRQLPELKKNADELAEASKEKNAKNSPILKENIETAARLKDIAPKFKELEDKRREYEEARKKAEELKRGCDDLSKAICELEAKRELLADAGEKIVRLEAEIKDLDGTSGELNKLKTELSELDRLREKYNTAERAFTDSQKEADDAAAHSQELRRLFNAEQAGILAEKLTDGMPCPVCGSTAHPKKAERSVGAPTSEEVKKAEDAAMRANKKASDLSAACGTAKGNLDAKTENVNEQLCKLLPGTDIEQAEQTITLKLAELQAKTDALKVQLSAEKADLDDRTRLEKELPAKKDELARLQKKLDGQSNKASETKGTADELANRIKSAPGAAELSGEADVNRRIDEINAQSDALRKETDKAKQAADDAENALQTAKSNSELYEQQLERSGEPIDIEEKKSAQEKLVAAEKDLQAKMNSLEVRLTVNRDRLEKLRGHLPKTKDAEKHYMLVKQLSELSNGSYGKLQLEAFVQKTFLDKVLDNANVHLMFMSDGQYELRQPRNVGNKMELNILEYDKGVEREVKSLSGGESFITALSLALGLSETVQQSSGGVRLDTMFVDEGFGSLSDNYLAKAITELQALTASDRLIGIISHVEDVKSRIGTKRIEITKNGANGSKAEIIV